MREIFPESFKPVSLEPDLLWPRLVEESIKSQLLVNQSSVLDWRSVIRLAQNCSPIPPHDKSLRQPVPLSPVPVALRDLKELCVVLVEILVTSVVRDLSLCL